MSSSIRQQQKALVTSSIRTRTNLSNDSVLGQPASDRSYASFRSNAWSPSVSFSDASKQNNNNNKTTCLTHTNADGESVASVCVDASGIQLSTNQIERLLVNVSDGSFQFNNDVSLEAPDGPSTRQLKFSELASNGSNYVSLQAPTSLPSGSTEYVLPVADGNPSDVLTTNGSGVLSWTTGGSGGNTSFADDQFYIYDNADVDSRIYFNADALGGLSYTYAAPNLNGFLVGADSAANIACGATNYVFNNSGGGPYTGWNTFFGVGTGAATTTGAANTAVGSGGCFESNTQGFANVCIGSEAMKNATTAIANVAVGHDALINTVSGFGNVAIGPFALSNTATNFNIGIGYNSLLQNTSGQGNIGIGIQALEENTSGLFNISLGGQTGSANTTGSRNTYVGHESGYYNETGNDNVAFGYNALQRNATAIGSRSASRNVALGVGAMSLVENTDDNIAVGYNAFIRALTPGTHNIAIGSDSLSGRTTFEGSRNICVGVSAGSDLDLTSQNNILIGAEAGIKLTTGSFNVGIGGFSLGSSAPLNPSTMSDTVAIGYYALPICETGERNTVIGTRSQSSNVANSNNTSIGFESLYRCVADDNTAIGMHAGFSIDSGQRNVCIGASAGFNLNSGSDCIIIGANAQPNNGSATELVIGNENLRQAIVTTEVLAPTDTIRVKIGALVYKLLAVQL